MLTERKILNTSMEDSTYQWEDLKCCSREEDSKYQQRVRRVVQTSRIVIELYTRCMHVCMYVLIYVCMYKGL